MRKSHWIAAGALLLSLSATAALAADGEPGKAGKYQSNMVNASADCTTPTEFTGGALPFAACPATDNPSCTFGDKGQAKVQAKAKDDVSLALKIKGLENCPDGTVLQAFASFKSTTNNCTVSGRCTTTSIPAFPIPGATCTVSGGGCQLKTTLNTLIPNLITPGENTAIELGTIGVGVGTVNVAVAGLLVP
ncbi:MAG: hypothetical protein SF182_18265 [Deltaproteobacteria bacterium]|nr:hypothetical protein [Deltaproteobacteria bacterium]